MVTKNVAPMSNSSYDFLKKVVEIGLPALGTMYFTLSQIWGLPRGEEVVGTIAAITVFLGVILTLSNRAYKSDVEDLEI